MRFAGQRLSRVRHVTVHAAMRDKGAGVFAIRDAVAEGYARHGLHGHAENKLYGGMQVLRKLGDIGAQAVGDDPKTAVFTLPS